MMLVVPIERVEVDGALVYSADDTVTVTVSAMPFASLTVTVADPGLTPVSVNDPSAAGGVVVVTMAVLPLTTV